MTRLTGGVIGSIVLAYACCCDEVSAVTNDWLPVSGEWNTAANWSPAAVPGASDMARITNQTVSYTVTYSNVMAAAGITNLVLSQTWAAGRTNTITLNINTNGFNVNDLSGNRPSVNQRGVINVNTGGVFYVASSYFYFIDGTLNLNGGVFTNNSAAIFGGYNDGGGGINVYGGSLYDNAGTIYIGANTGDSYLNNTGGVVSVNYLIVGWGGKNGYVTNSGGVLIMRGGSGLRFGGNGVQGAGNMLISGGVVSNCGTALIGTSNSTDPNNRAKQTGGSWYQQGDMWVGYAGACTGIVTLVDNASFIGGGDVTVGRNAPGIFTIGGGNFVLTNANKSLTVTNGTLNVTNGVAWINKLVATNGVSTLNFGGGVVNVKTALVSNGSAFVVGDGSHAATLNLMNGGSNLFANGLTLNSNATLLVGGSNAAGSTIINGSVTIQPNAVLNCDFTSTTQDTVRVVGAVTLPMVATVTLDYLDVPRPPSNFTFLTASDGITGSDLSGWTINGTGTQNYRYLASVSGNTVVLTRQSKATIMVLY